MRKIAFAAKGPKTAVLFIAYFCPQKWITFLDSGIFYATFDHLVTKQEVSCLLLQYLPGFSAEDNRSPLGGSKEKLGRKVFERYLEGFRLNLIYLIREVSMFVEPKQRSKKDMICKTRA